MKKIGPSSIIRDVISEVPSLGLILQQFGIDPGREADRSLDRACQLAGVSLSDVMRALGPTGRQPSDDIINESSDFSLAGLMTQIVTRHHAYCRKEMERLEQLLTSVIRRLGDRHQELHRVRSLFMKMGNDLKQHLVKEEQTLFPMIARMEEARNRQATPPRFPFGSIANPIRMMIMEHGIGDRELEEIRKLTSDYRVPPDVDEEYRGLLQGLRDFEQDMQQHVYLENERLFPRAIALESGSAASSASHQ